MTNHARIIEKTLQETLGNDIHFDENSSFEDLNIDSIEKAEIAIKLQKALQLTFDFYTFQSLKFIGQIYSYVQSFREEKNDFI